MTYLSKGDVALSVACTSVTTLAAPILTPFLVWLFASQYLPVDAWAMFISIVKVVLLPLAVGFAAQKLLPRVVKAAVPTLPLVSVVGIVLIVSAVVAASRGAIAESGLMIFLVVVLHNGLGYLLGFFAAKASGLTLAKRKAIAIDRAGDVVPDAEDGTRHCRCRGEIGGGQRRTQSAVLHADLLSNYFSGRTEETQPIAVKG